MTVICNFLAVVSHFCLNPAAVCKMHICCFRKKCSARYPECKKERGCVLIVLLYLLRWKLLIDVGEKVKSSWKYILGCIPPCQELGTNSSSWEKSILHGAIPVWFLQVHHRLTVFGLIMLLLPLCYSREAGRWSSSNWSQLPCIFSTSLYTHVHFSCWFV